MQCRLVVCYQSFVTTYRSHFKREAVKEESRNVEFTVMTAPLLSPFYSLLSELYSLKLVLHTLLSVLKAFFPVQYSLLSKLQDCLPKFYTSLSALQAFLLVHTFFFLKYSLLSVLYTLFFWYCILYCRCQVL